MCISMPVYRYWLELADISSNCGMQDNLEIGKKNHYRYTVVALYFILILYYWTCNHLTVHSIWIISSLYLPKLCQSVNTWVQQISTNIRSCLVWTAFIFWWDLKLWIFIDTTIQFFSSHIDTFITELMEISEQSDRSIIEQSISIEQ